MMWTLIYIAGNDLNLTTRINFDKVRDVYTITQTALPRTTPINHLTP